MRQKYYLVADLRKALVIARSLYFLDVVEATRIISITIYNGRGGYVAFVVL